MTRVSAEKTAIAHPLPRPPDLIIQARRTASALIVTRSVSEGLSGIVTSRYIAPEGGQPAPIIQAPCRPGPFPPRIGPGPEWAKEINPG